MVIRYQRGDPDVTIVTKDHTGPTQQVVKMVFASFHKRRWNSDQCALG